MAYPVRPSRRTSFTQAANAGLAFSNANLDSEHNDFVEQIDQLNTFIRGVTTAAGTLKNLATATAQALSGSQRFVATASQTIFDTTILYVAAFSNLNVEVFSQGIKIDPNLVTVANNAGNLRVTIPAQLVANVVQVAAFESGAGLLTRLMNTASASDGANMIGIQDVGALIAATTVEGALAEIITALNTFIANVGTIANIFKADGSVTATGNFNLGSRRITALADGIATTDAATVAQVNAASASLATLANSFIKRDGTNSPSADVSWNSKKITSLATPTAATDAATKGYADGLLTAAAPTGAWIGWLTGTAPTGWLICDGSAVSRTTYAALFALLGTAFGAGDGTTTFNLPDFRGRSPLGAGTGLGLNTSGTGAPAGSALTTRTLGQWGGEETHLLTTAEMPSHTHTLTYQQGTADNLAGTFGESRFTGANTITSDATGGGTRHATLPPFIVTNVIIKT